MTTFSTRNNSPIRCSPSIRQRSFHRQPSSLIIQTAYFLAFFLRRGKRSGQLGWMWNVKREM